MRLERYSTPLGDTLLPKARLRFRQTGTAHWSQAVFTGIVDTGAAYTLANRAVAKVLGLDDQAIDAGKEVYIDGAGGASFTARELHLDLAVGVPDTTKCLILPNASVCFTQKPLPFEILIGQISALRSVELHHFGQDPDPRYLLRWP